MTIGENSLDTSFVCYGGSVPNNYSATSYILLPQPHECFRPNSQTIFALNNTQQLCGMNPQPYECFISTTENPTHDNTEKEESAYASSYTKVATSTAASAVTTIFLNVTCFVTGACNISPLVNALILVASYAANNDIMIPNFVGEKGLLNFEVTVLETTKALAEVFGDVIVSPTNDQTLY